MRCFIISILQMRILLEDIKEYLILHSIIFLMGDDSIFLHISFFTTFSNSYHCLVVTLLKHEPRTAEAKTQITNINIKNSVEMKIR